MIDENIGKQYEHCFCPKCKAKVMKEMSKIKRYNKFRQMAVMANPNSMALRLQRIICPACRKRLLKEMRK